MQGIRIRPATPEDLDFIVLGNCHLAHETEQLILDPARVTAGVGHLLAHPELGHYWIAEVAQQPAGQCMITTEWSDWRNAPMWWFQSVYVQPEFRRQGVFRALHRHVQNEARQQGVGELRLYVEKDNHSAQSTYRQLGMQGGHYEVFEQTL